MTASSTELRCGRLTRGEPRRDLRDLTDTTRAIYALERKTYYASSRILTITGDRSGRQVRSLAGVRLKELVEDGVQVFALGGDIDLHFSPVLRGMFQAKLKLRCPALILDFREVEFIDSRGIATIIEYYRDSGEYGGKVCLAALSPEVRPIIETVKLETVMSVFPTVAEAASAMKRTVQSPQPT